MLATKLSIVIYPKGYKCNISASNNAEVKTSKLYVHSHLIDIYFLHLKTDDMIPIVTHVTMGHATPVSWSAVCGFVLFCFLCHQNQH